MRRRKPESYTSTSDLSKRPNRTRLVRLRSDPQATAGDERPQAILEFLGSLLTGFLDVARPRQAIGQAERRERLREASPRGSVGGGRASSRN
eukprot:1187274-Prorocentrum_minimum.AAC.5